MLDPISIRLPWPPTVNTMWRTITKGRLAGRTLLSEQGREFRRQANLQVMAQRIPVHTLRGKLAVEIRTHAGDRRARDLDNLLKAPLDALKHAGVIDDDQHIDDLHIVRGDLCRESPHVVVTIREIPSAELDLFEAPARRLTEEAHENGDGV